MAKERLVGGEWASNPGYQRTPGYFGANKYTVIKTGVAVEWSSYADITGKGKFAAYLDNGSDHPGALLGAIDSDCNCTGGVWNNFSQSPFSVESGQSVWLGAICDTMGTLTSDPGGTLRYTAYSYASWAASDPCVSLINTFGHTLGVKLLGYAVPLISSIDGDNIISDLQENVVLLGASLLDSAGNAVLELCNNSDYGSATIKVTQTFKSQTDTSLTFDVVQGALSEGIVYAFVTTGLGQRNLTGFPVTLNAAGVEDSVIPIEESETLGQFLDSVSVVDTLVGVTDTSTFGQYSDTISVLDGFDGVLESETLSVFTDVVEVLDSSLGVIESETLGEFFDVFQYVDLVGTVQESETLGEFLDVFQYIDSVVTVQESETLGEFLDVLTLMDSVTYVAESEVYGTFYDIVGSWDSVVSILESEIYGEFFDNFKSADLVDGVVEAEEFGIFYDIVGEGDLVSGVDEVEVLGSFNDILQGIDGIDYVEDTETYGQFLDYIEVPELQSSELYCLVLSEVEVFLDSSSSTICKKI